VTECTIRNGWKKAERENVEREKYRKQEYEVRMNM
jgi:hypothetical protein